MHQRRPLRSYSCTSQTSNRSPPDFPRERAIKKFARLSLALGISSPHRRDILGDQNVCLSCSCSYLDLIVSDSLEWLWGSSRVLIHISDKSFDSSRTEGFCTTYSIAYPLIRNIKDRSTNIQIYRIIVKIFFSRSTKLQRSGLNYYFLGVKVKIL